MVARSETFPGSVDDARAFCAVIDFRTISAAASQLGETKGSVSRRITRLENALGVRLLARTARAVSPSSEGLAFYDKALAALSLLDDATEDVRKSRHELRGFIRVTAPIDVAVELLPNIVAGFRRQHPKITIEILATDAILDLTAHRTDLALRIGVDRLPDMALQAPVIARLAIGVFASPAYLERHPAPNAPAGLVDHGLVLPRERPGLTHLTLSNGSRDEKVLLRPVVRASDFACLLRLAVAGAGVAALPDILAQKWVADGSLVRVLPGWSWSGPTLHAVTATGSLLPARVRAFRDYVGAHVAHDGRFAV